MEGHTVEELAMWQGESEALLQNQLASQLRHRGILLDERSNAALEAILKRWIRGMATMNSLCRWRCSASSEINFPNVRQLQSASESTFIRKLGTNFWH